MDDIATLRSNDRSDLFLVAAEAKGVNVQVIEKDFWVCWTLKHLFSNGVGDDALTFKGGTSLSKVFRLIERMSEDIDLVIDRRLLGFAGNRDPRNAALGTHARQRLIDELLDSNCTYVSKVLARALRDAFVRVIGDAGDWSLHVDASDRTNPRILFNYPTNLPPAIYLKRSIELEIGARGDPWPTIAGNVRPYAADAMPWSNGPVYDVAVRALAPERTFLEKVTLLHALAQQPARMNRLDYMSRHFYDVHMLWKDGIGKSSVEQLGLLADVIQHKQAMFRQPSARYELALARQLQLVPSAGDLQTLRADYASLAEQMIFGIKPDLAEILESMREIEHTINCDR